MSTYSHEFPCSPRPWLVACTSMLLACSARNPRFDPGGDALATAASTETSDVEASASLGSSTSTTSGGMRPMSTSGGADLCTYNEYRPFELSSGLPVDTSCEEGGTRVTSLTGRVLFDKGQLRFTPCPAGCSCPAVVPGQWYTLPELPEAGLDGTLLECAQVDVWTRARGGQCSVVGLTVSEMVADGTFELVLALANVLALPASFPRMSLGLKPEHEACSDVMCGELTVGANALNFGSEVGESLVSSSVPPPVLPASRLSDDPELLFVLEHRGANVKPGDPCTLEVAWSAQRFVDL